MEKNIGKIYTNINEYHSYKLLLESKPEDISIIEDYFIELVDWNPEYKMEVIVDKFLISAKRINGFKIQIIYDHYYQLIVKKDVDLALKRLRNDYIIHSNRISKSNNGYQRKSIPVHGKDTFASISDPIWKTTITISKKN